MANRWLTEPLERSSNMNYKLQATKKTGEVTQQLVDRLDDVQLIDNTPDQAAMARQEIDVAVCAIVAPLERERDFLKARVKFLEKQVDELDAKLATVPALLIELAEQQARAAIAKVKEEGGDA